MQRERASLREEGPVQRGGGWLGRGIWVGAGGPPGSRQRSLPPTHRLLLSALPGGDWPLYLGCDPLLPSASQALLPG